MFVNYTLDASDFLLNPRMGMGFVVQPATDGSTRSPEPRRSYFRKGSFEIKKRTFVTQECLEKSQKECRPDFCEMEDGVCECLTPKSQGNSGSGGTWLATDDPAVVMMDESEVRYCVSGDTLAIELVRYDGPYLVFYTRETKMTTHAVTRPLMP